MRLIHTADWHLGQNFHGYSRLKEQQAFLEWLLLRVREYQPDALLVAGDLFDTLVPPAAAQRLLFDFFARLKREAPWVTVVVIAGNHDSGIRLESPAELLAGMDIHTLGQVHRGGAEGTVDYSLLTVSIPLRSGGEGTVLAVPYLRMGDCPTVDVQGQPTQSIADGTKAFYEEFSTHLAKGRGNCKGPWVCVGHMLVKGGTFGGTSTGVDPLIGNLEAVPTEVFPPCDYVALGHLHRYQRVGHTGNIYYSGSPLPMAFDERGYPHGVLLVDIPEKASGEGSARAVEVEFIPFEAPVKLLSIRGDAAYCERAFGEFPEGEADDASPIVSLTLQIQAPSPSLREDIQRWLQGRRVRLGPVKLEVPRADATGDDRAVDYPGLASEAPLPRQIAQAEYHRRFGCDMPPELSRLLDEAIEGAMRSAENGEEEGR